ncbi:MAG: hypothetical protein NC102_07690 [Clostridium sp.]|nr:hypothetical protein [Clostridium sp.]
MSLLSEDFEDEFFSALDKSIEFERMFQKGVSVLVIDPNDKFKLNDRPKEDQTILYFDMSECAEGDFARIARKIYEHVKAGELDGLLFDNIDRMPDVEDKGDLENLVAFALKNDSDYSAPVYGDPIIGGPIPFDRMKVGARCREYPEFLNDYHVVSFLLEID